MNVSTKQQRIAEIARQHAGEGITNLNHHVDMEWLREAYHRLRKDSAPGVDGQTVAAYGESLEENLSLLLERAKTGTYVAPPVRRKHIPKGSGKETRPIGIPTTEDKILQRAVVMLLEPIYEEDFYEFSFAFRPGRSPHAALDYLWHQAMACRTRWILEVDIRKFFDTLDQAKLRGMLERRVRDGVILRLIGKWLKAGVLEEGRHWYPEGGTPQGGVISPLLSNVYLHETFDEWFAQTVKPRLHGRAFAVRFADDIVMGFESRADAEKVFKVLPKRFEKYGLGLHPEKTRLVPFRRPPSYVKKTGSWSEKPGTFDFLGFTHHWGWSPSKGNWYLMRRTAGRRFSRSLHAVRDWCRANLHRPLAEPHRALCAKVTGHYAYYGITGNVLALERFREEVKRVWHHWLNRRRGNRAMPWARFNALVNCRFRLPSARVVHSVCAAKP